MINGKLVPLEADFETLQDFFHEKGIHTEKPGFYDSPQFLSIERLNPEFLNWYARFVDTQPYTAEYFRRSRHVTTVIAQSLQELLFKDGRQGACVDLSSAFSRMLDQEGIWNYVARGALAIFFPNETGINSKHFWTIECKSNSQETTAPHAWLVAPPFLVVDLTIKQQPYPGRERLFLPDSILEEYGKECEIDVADLCEPLVVEDFAQRGVKKEDMIITIFPNLKKFFYLFPPKLIEKNRIKFKYIRTAIGATDQGLEGIENLKLNGMYPLEIYTSIIRPRIKNLKI